MLESDARYSAFGHRPLLDRYSIQIPLLVFGTLAVQAAVVLMFHLQDRIEQSTSYTLAATLLCNLAAAMIFREIRRIPGTRKFAFIFPAFFLSYSAFYALVIVLRLPYSLWLTLAGAASGLMLLWLFNVILQTSLRPDIFIKRSPMTDILMRDVRQTNFMFLESPSGLARLQRGTVIIDLREKLEAEWEREIAHAVLRGISVYHVKQAYESMTGRVRFDSLSENSFGSLVPAMSYIFLKRVGDFLLSLVLLVLLSLPMMVIALVIRATSPGPAIFRQERIGHRGAPFEIYKFRTMAHDNRLQSLEGHITRHADPRITGLGRWLRNTRLDELPQLFNVLRGDMSLIGPRPEARSLSEWYKGTLDFYDNRHIVKPGITGWAQVKLGHVTGVEDTYLKTQYDFFYIKNLSAWLDFLIALKTLEIMILGRGSR